MKTNFLDFSLYSNNMVYHGLSHYLYNVRPPSDVNVGLDSPQ
jgi:hypothetical protein